MGYIMNIRFKSLLAFGGGLWVSLLVTDWFYERPQATEEISKESGFLYNILGTTQTSKMTNKVESLQETSDGAFAFGWTLLFWNLVAFVLSISTCVFIKNSLAFFTTLYHKYSSPPAVICAPPNTTYIDTKNPEIAPKVEAIETEVSTEIMSSNYSTTTADSKNMEKSGFERHLEQECAKMRAEMIAMQSASIQENEMLSKKLEAVAKEKREMSKQLSVAQKENRAAKRQLEDLIMEKDLLLKRLDCANKEFRLNSRTKRSVMEQLQESKVQIETLKKQVTEYAEEKNKIERRIEMLDRQYEAMVKRGESGTQMANRMVAEKPVDKGEELKKVAGSPPKISSTSSEAEIKQHTYNSSDSTMEKESNNVEIAEKENRAPTQILSQSELDMRKVHLKLMKLEQSLEALRKRKLALKQREKEEEEERLKQLKEENSERGTVAEKLKDEMQHYQKMTAISASAETGLSNVMSLQTRQQLIHQLQHPQTQPVIVLPVQHAMEYPPSNFSNRISVSPVPKRPNAMGNLTDEQREKIFGPDKEKVTVTNEDSSSTNDVTSTDSLIEMDETESLTDDDHENRVEADGGERSSTYSALSDEEYERESGPMFNVSPGLISHSPAFRKFLEAFNAMQSPTRRRRKPGYTFN